MKDKYRITMMVEGKKMYVGKGHLDYTGDPKRAEIYRSKAWAELHIQDCLKHRRFPGWLLQIEKIPAEGEGE